MVQNSKNYPFSCGSGAINENIAAPAPDTAFFTGFGSSSENDAAPCGFCFATLFY
jgi:hypothetical protein